MQFLGAGIGVVILALNGRVVGDDGGEETFSGHGGAFQVAPLSQAAGAFSAIAANGIFGHAGGSVAAGLEICNYPCVKMIFWTRRRNPTTSLMED